MRFAIVTMVTTIGESHNALTLVESIRAFSMADTVCMVVGMSIGDEDRYKLATAYDKIIDVGYVLDSNTYTRLQCLQLEEYDKVLYLDVATPVSIVSRIDHIFSLDTPAGCFDVANSEYQSRKHGYKGPSTTVKGIYGNLKHGDKVPTSAIIAHKDDNTYSIDPNILLLKPNRFALECFKLKVVGIPTMKAITTFYAEMGSQWYHIDMRYNIPYDTLYDVYDMERGKDVDFTYKVKGIDTNKHLANTKTILYGPKIVRYTDKVHRLRPPVRPDLIQHLIERLTIAIGPEALEIVPKFARMYDSCLTHESVDKVYNYEMLEAFGDSYLKGTLGWIFSSTPGILTPEHLTMVIHNLQSMYTLEYIFDRLSLEPYYMKGKDTIYNSKVKSDIVEALICAIGISWEKTQGNGEKAVLRFVLNTFDELRTLDPLHIESMYKEPVSIAKELLEKYVDVNAKLTPEQAKIYPNKLSDSGSIIGTNRYKHVVTIGTHVLGSATIPIIGKLPDQYQALGRNAAYQDMLDRKSIQRYLKDRFTSSSVPATIRLPIGSTIIPTASSMVLPIGSTIRLPIGSTVIPTVSSMVSPTGSTSTVSPMVSGITVASTNEFSDRLFTEQGKYYYYPDAGKKYKSETTYDGYMALREFLTHIQRMLDEIAIRITQSGKNLSTELAYGLKIYSDKPSMTKGEGTWSTDEYQSLGFQYQYIKMKSIQRFTETYALMERTYRYGLIDKYTSKCSVISIGGGPGFELYAMRAFMTKHMKGSVFTGTSMDIVDTWSKYVVAQGFTHVQGDFTNTKTVYSVCSGMDLSILSYVIQPHMGNKAHTIIQWILNATGSIALCNERRKTIYSKDMKGKVLPTTGISRCGGVCISSLIGDDDYRQAVVYRELVVTPHTLDGIYPNVPY